MTTYRYLNEHADFELEDPEMTSYLYFPIANEQGVMSCVTPTLAGDNKLGQNEFLLTPESCEDLHNSKASRNFWVHIKGKGVWSATGKSSAQQALYFTDKKEQTKLTAGFMWHRLERISKEYQMESIITSFVPCTGEKLELMMVELKNIGEKPQSITPIAAIPMYARSAANIRDHRHVTSLLHRIKTTTYGVLVNPTLTFDERGHQKNHVVYGVLGAADGQAPIGFYPVIEEFIGEGGTLEQPKAVYQYQEMYHKGTEIDGYEALGGLVFKDRTLQPGQTATYIIAMGYGASEEELEDSAVKFMKEEVCRTSLVQTREYWRDKVNIRYQSKQKEFDHWMQWVNFQPMLRRIYGCSFLPHHDYGKGGRGWRDLWQDCLALLLMEPANVRSMLIDNYAGVRMDGTNATIIGTKQGEFIADRNNITRVWSDHGVWPLITTNLYIQLSGDIDLLLVDQNYFKDPQENRGRDKDQTWTPALGNRLHTKNEIEYRGSILEHILVQNLTAFYDVGEHNHMLLRGADWNDALDMAKDRGESVAFTAAYAGNLETLSELLLELYQQKKSTIWVAKEIALLLTDNKELYDNIEKKKQLLSEYCASCKHNVSGEQIEIDCKKLSDNLKAKADWMKEHIRKTEWINDNGEHSWFNGYYDNDGTQVEGNYNNLVHMMLTSQVFTIMQQVASKDQIQKIIQAADCYLYSEELGGYRLNTDFKEVRMNLGRMFGFAYGQKENGAVFSHMAVMYANALYRRGFVKEGYKVIHSLFSHCNDFTKSHIYPGVPEYIGGNGRGMYHYLTGAASWLLLTVLTQMYGIQGRMGDMVLSPKLLKEQFDDQGMAKVSFTFADRMLTVIYHNTKHMEYGTYQIQSVRMEESEYEVSKESNSFPNEYVIRRSDICLLTANQEHVIKVEIG